MKTFQQFMEARPPNCPRCGKMASKGHKCKKRDELPIPPTRMEIKKEKKNRAELIRNLSGGDWIKAYQLNLRLK